MLLSHNEVRGRKEYVCSLCGLRIRKGALHIAQTIKDDGVRTIRMHAVCYDAFTEWDLIDQETWVDDPYNFRKYDLKMRSN